MPTVLSHLLSHPNKLLRCWVVTCLNLAIYVCVFSQDSKIKFHSGFVVALFLLWGLIIMLCQTKNCLHCNVSTCTINNLIDRSILMYEVNFLSWIGSNYGTFCLCVGRVSVDFFLYHCFAVCEHKILLNALLRYQNIWSSATLRMYWHSFSHSHFSQVSYVVVSINFLLVRSVPT